MGFPTGTFFAEKLGRSGTFFPLCSFCPGKEGEYGIGNWALALSVLGGLLGVLSFVQSRDKSVEKDAAWRGGVDAKLDMILGMQKDLEGIKASLKDHEGRLSAVESSAKSAHHRLDEYA